MAELFCFVKGPSLSPPEDIQSALEQYLNSNDNAELDNLYHVLEESIAYAHASVFSVACWILLGLRSQRNKRLKSRKLEIT
jgi:hypothetical protein